MKKLPLTAFLIGSLFLSSIILTAIAFLTKLSIKPEGLNIDQLIHGELIQLLMLNEFWSRYPTLPTAQVLFLPNAFILMALLLAAAIYFLAFRQKYHPLIVSTVLLLTALFPYAIGRLALASNQKPENAGVWLAFMLAGVLYATVASALFSAVQIAKNWSKPVLAKR
jgi:hypothetical protein